MIPFCGATDTPILDFWSRILRVSKPEWVLSYSSLVEAYVLHYMFPEIHLWCDTCWPLGGQHGSWAISSTYLQGIGGTRNRKLSCYHLQCEIRQARGSTDWAIPARLFHPAFDARYKIWNKNGILRMFCWTIKLNPEDTWKNCQPYHVLIADFIVFILKFVRSELVNWSIPRVLLGNVMFLAWWSRILYQRVKTHSQCPIVIATKLFLKPRVSFVSIEPILRWSHCITRYCNWNNLRREK